MLNESEAEIALRLACNDMARMQSSAFGTPFDGSCAEEISEDYLRKARRIQGSKAAAEKARGVKGAG